MTPPLPPEDVAGIGHRFGQEMDVGEPQHSGVDLQAPEGTPTKSPVDGFVVRVEDNPQGLGVTVIIKGMDGSEHRLGHLRDTKAFPGMQVAMGQDLGSPVGETGMTTGAHLHWGVKDGQGQPADPTAALGPMANMPPVPGTEMMGPPGGVGGGAQTGMPPMGGGQEPMPGAPPPQEPSIGQNMTQFFKPKEQQGAGADEDWAGGPEFGTWVGHMPDAQMPFNGGLTSEGSENLSAEDFPPGAMEAFYEHGMQRDPKVKIDRKEAFGPNAGILDPSQFKGWHKPGQNILDIGPNVFKPPGPLGPNIQTGPVKLPGGHTPGPELKLPDWLSSRLPGGGGQSEPERIIPGFSRPEKGLGNIMPASVNPSDQQSGGRERSLLDLENMGDVKINPLDAFGTGQESKGKRKRKKAGWKPRQGAGQAAPVPGAQGPPPQPGQGGSGDMNGMLQQLLMQEWQRMQQERGGAQPPQPAVPQGGGF